MLSVLYQYGYWAEVARPVAHLSPRARTEKHTPSILAGASDCSQSQNSRASAGGTPSPCTEVPCLQGSGHCCVPALPTQLFFKCMRCCFVYLERQPSWAVVLGCNSLTCRHCSNANAAAGAGAQCLTWVEQMQRMVCTPLRSRPAGTSAMSTRRGLQIEDPPVRA